MTRKDRNLAVALAALAAITVPTAASAYVGPGAGLSLLGALWALIAAVATALLFVVAWPVRKLMRRRRVQQRPTDAPMHGERSAPGS